MMPSKCNISTLKATMCKILHPPMQSRFRIWSLIEITHSPSWFGRGQNRIICAGLIRLVQVSPPVNLSLGGLINSVPLTFSRATSVSNGRSLVKSKMASSANSASLTAWRWVIFYYILIREGIRFMQNVTPPFLSNVHVLRPSGTLFSKRCP